jgi:hypothetical protein
MCGTLSLNLATPMVTWLSLPPSMIGMTLAPFEIDYALGIVSLILARLSRH